MNNREKALFYHHLSTMLRAGIPLSEAVKECPVKKYRNLWLNWSDQIRVHHLPLSELMINHASFISFESEMFRVGEETGTMPEISNHLEVWFEKRIEFKHKLITSLLYPCFMLALLPLFLNFHVWFTTGSFSKFIKLVLLSYAPVVLISIGLYFLHYVLQRKIKSILYERVLCLIPLYGKILRNHFLLDIVLVLSISQRCGLSFLRSLQLAEGVSKSELFRQYLLDAMSECSEGRSMHYILRDFPYLDDHFIDMIKVGEATGSVDKSFDKIYQIKTEQNALYSRLFLMAISFGTLLLMGGIIAYHLVKVVMKYIGMVENVGKF